MLRRSREMSRRYGPPGRYRPLPGRPHAGCCARSSRAGAQTCTLDYRRQVLGLGLYTVYGTRAGARWEACRSRLRRAPQGAHADVGRCGGTARSSMCRCWRPREVAPRPCVRPTLEAADCGHSYPDAAGEDGCCRRHVHGVRSRQPRPRRRTVRHDAVDSTWPAPLGDGATARLVQATKSRAAARRCRSAHRRSPKRPHRR
jgi:hypothetical protein